LAFKQWRAEFNAFVTFVAFPMRNWILILLAGVAIASASCHSTRTDEYPLPYRKVMKLEDLEEKFRYAEYYLKEGKCTQALPLYEELIPAFRLTEKGELCYLQYARSYYCLKDFYLAGYYFKSFAKNNPQSPHSEEALFLSAICHVKTSPDKELDQTETMKALDELQLFIDLYPESVLVDSCSNIMDGLRKKLEDKNYDIAMEYLKTENYKAAAVAFQTYIDDYPASARRESAMFYRLKAQYLLATNSVDNKKASRFEQVRNTYRIFVASFPNSRFRDDADHCMKGAERFTEGTTNSQDTP
jgi:outer membrane protein assembly factor BamD